MNDLIAFVSARLDEDEPSDRCGCLDANHIPACTPQPWKDRELREIAADRRLLAELERCAGDQGWDDAIMLAVRLRATKWSDHPDYQAGWAP